MNEFYRNPTGLVQQKPHLNCTFSHRDAGKHIPLAIAGTAHTARLGTHPGPNLERLGFRWEADVSGGSWFGISYAT
ncbi:hypothetical protein [Nocardia sp. NPDC052566]|uniref:hypothetical protein n=1 Tax=Nocardia sp. NPDC052566 TaxID=3364330 RepID=UPI0037C5512D